MQPTKPCIACLEKKPLDGFYKHPHAADSRMGVCKDCHKARMVLRARTNPAVQAYDRLRSKLPHRQAHTRRVSDAWNARNPDGYKAHYTVSNAIRDGKLERQPCTVCGDPRSHAHHHDYSKPLDVTWLCALHHHRGHADGVI